MTLLPSSPNVSTTPLRQWGFRQCLPFSWTTLRGKHCRHLIAVMGVVDMFGLCFDSSIVVTVHNSTTHACSELLQNMYTVTISRLKLGLELRTFTADLYRDIDIGYT